MNRAFAISTCLALLAAVGCGSDSAARDGACQPDTAHALACAEDYAGYVCTGSARPDEAPQFIEGVPQGRVCADRSVDEAHGYCCTTRPTTCAYNPTAACDDPGYGYQCIGANRPDALNAALRCGNGLREGGLIDYCCSGMPVEPGCLQSDSVSCPSRLSGWTCRGQQLPRSEQLGASKSRSDFFRLLCSSPMPAANPDYNNYCCFTPAPLPVGGSCVQHTSVPGCSPGRFGFACYGPDTPGDDYAPVRCPEPSVTGLSAEGYPAKLYCCDFK